MNAQARSLRGWVAAAAGVLRPGNAVVRAVSRPAQQAAAAFWTPARMAAATPLAATPATGTGTVFGVIGGYQQGGTFPWASYSAYSSGPACTLFRQAERQ